MSVSKSNWHVISNILRLKFSCHISFSVSGVTKESCSSKGVTNKSALQTQRKDNHLIKTRVKQKKVNISPHFNVLYVRQSLIHIVFSTCNPLNAFYSQCPIWTHLTLKYWCVPLHFETEALHAQLRADSSYQMDTHFTCSFMLLRRANWVIAGYFLLLSSNT